MSSMYNRAKVTKTISITSGKGGVGKSTIAANLALNLSKLGKKVLILDGDFGMANLDIMFGINTRDSIESVLLGQKELKDIICNVGNNIDLIPGGSGVYSLNRMSMFQKRFLMDQVSKLEGVYDYMLIDTAPGIDDDVLYLNSAANEVSIVLTPDPSSILDSYALIKVLNQKYKEVNFSIITNLVKDKNESIRLYRAISDMAEEQLCVHLKYLGYIPTDSSLRNAVKSRQLVSLSNPRSPSSFAIRDLAQNMSSISNIKGSKGGMQFFWGQMLNVA